MTDLTARTPPPWGRIALAWLALVALLVVAGWDRLADWRLADPDDVLRVVQVRDLLAGQAWFDLHQYRINPGESPVMHWSRIVDAPLLLFVMLLTPLLGPEMAENVTVFVMPLLTLGAIVAVVGQMAHRLFGEKIAIFACLACGLSPILLGQVQPLRVDHHGWQVFAVLAAASGLLQRDQRRGGLIAGLSMAAGLLISIEVLPLAAAFAAIMLLRGLRDPAQRWWLPCYLVSLALGLVGLFGLTRGFADLTQYCDAISPAHLLFFMAVSCLSAAVAAGRFSPVVTLGLLISGGGAALAILLWQAPACFAGPFGSLDPIVRKYWYLNVFEGRPVWIQPLSLSLPIVAQTLVALSASALLWRRCDARQRGWWMDYTLLLGAAIIGGFLVWRSMAFAGALAALPNGWLIDRLIRRYRTGRSPAIRIGAVVAAIFALLPSSPAALATMLQDQKNTGSVSKLGLSRCTLHQSLAQLNSLEPAVLFAAIDIGPDILNSTHHSVVATGHHRAQAAMANVITAYLSPDDRARSIIAKHGARFVAVCTDLYEPQLYALRSPNGLMSHLLDGKPPKWLQEVPLDAPSTLKVWRVVD